MEATESKAFLRLLGLTATVWALLGSWIYRADPVAQRVFLETFFWVFLDLFFLILLFWSLFFSPPHDPRRRVRVVLLLTFKLVCLGFLAITLKRLRNELPSPVVAAVCFMVAGPLLAAGLGRWVLGKR